MYFRSKIDAVTQSSVREVVDGQQRLLAIFEFADDKLRLTKRAGEFAGMRYSDLDEDAKNQFLAYTFVAEQLINASDDEVLEVFARTNTYTVALNRLFAVKREAGGPRGVGHAAAAALASRIRRW